MRSRGRALARLARAFLGTGCSVSMAADAKAREVKVNRKVLAGDQASARKMRMYFNVDEDDSFPGTVPGISASLVTDLRTTGKAAGLVTGGFGESEPLATNETPEGRARNRRVELGRE